MSFDILFAFYLISAGTKYISLNILNCPANRLSSRPFIPILQIRPDKYIEICIICGYNKTAV